MPDPPYSGPVAALLLEAATTDPMGLLIAGPDVVGGRGPTVRFANATFAAITGKPAEEALGRPLADALGGSSAVPDLDALLAGVQRGEHAQAELCLQRGDGAAYWARLACAPLRDPETGRTCWAVRLCDITERVQAEQTLRESEARYRSLVTGHPGIVYRCLYDRAWTTLFMSDAFEEACGWPSEAFVSGRLSFRSVVVEEDLPAIQAAVAQAVRSGQPYEMEYRVRRPDGSVRWIHDEGRVAHNADGRAHHLNGVMLDVTERHATQERLRLLETVVNDAMLSLLITDADFSSGGPHIVYANRGFERMSGYSAEEVIGRNPRLLQGPETDRAVLDRLKREVTRGGHFFGQTVNYKKDGTPFDIEWSVSPVADAEGRTTHYVAVQRDVSERRRAERQLRLLRAAVESTQDAVVVARPAYAAEAGAAAIPDADALVPAGDPTGLAVLYANPAFARLAGVDPEHVVGRDVVDLIDGAATELLEAAASGEARTLELRLTGAGAPFELAIAPLEQPEPGRPIRCPDADGDPVPDWWVLTLRDLSATKRAEAEAEARRRAEEMARLKSTLLANMSHEIRTPLTAVIGFAQMIAEEADGDAADFARRILSSGERLEETLSSVLDLAQLEAGAVEVHRRLVDLAAFVPETAALLAPLVERKGLRFDVEAPATPVLTRLDERHLTRILQNLIGNAAKFTERGGLRIRVWEDGPDAAIEISDTGVGMSEAFQARMFEAFQQESSGFDRAYEGNGLGLSLTRRLTELMGGRIEVVSALGEGSRFTLHFPGAFGPAGDGAPDGSAASVPRVARSAS